MARRKLSKYFKGLKEAENAKISTSFSQTSLLATTATTASYGNNFTASNLYVEGPILTDDIIGRSSNDYIYQDGTNVSFYIGGAEDFRMTSAGVFHADGDIIGNSTTISSDIKLKNNIKVIEDAIEKLSTLEGVTFNWNKDNKPSIGVIAQQVQKTFPELVTEVNNLNDEDTHLTVNYSGLIGVLIESIKELKKEIQELKSNK